MALLAWWLYYQSGNRNSARPWNWLLPTLRALAVFLIAITLAEPIIQSEQREGQPGKIVFLLDASRSMSLRDESPNTATMTSPVAIEEPASRYARAAYNLHDPITGLLRQLADTFDIEVRRTTTGGDSTLLYDSRSADPQPESDPGSIGDEADADAQWWTRNSPLGESISGLAELPGDYDETRPGTVFVLLSDGRSNAGRSPLETSEMLAGKGLPVFTVGYGTLQQPPDLSIRSASGPQRVFRDNIYRGSFMVAEAFPAGRSYTATVSHEGEVLWTEPLVSLELKEREVEFTFPVAKLLETAMQAAGTDVELGALQAKLDIAIRSEEDAYADNNSAAVFTSVAVQRARLLLLDGRSRWETRYLKNLFSRDPGWECDVEIASGSNPTRPLANFPVSRDALFQYNLVIIGDLPPSCLTPEQMQWLSEFVSRRGGGLMIVDGARAAWRDPGYEPLRELLPVRWGALASNSSARAGLPKQAIPTASGQALSALRLNPQEANSMVDVNQDAPSWSRLAPVQFVVPSEALPGSETLLEARSSVESLPMLVTRKFGAGRVLYWATDETWKWRYRLGDELHTRLWNQLAKWSMRAPPSIQGEFVSLDTGAPNYGPEETVEIRCQLRDQRGDAASNDLVTAVVRRDGRAVARLPMQENAELPGTYQIEFTTDEPGDYTVEIEAAGFPQEALRIQSNFSVSAPPSTEMQELTCDAALLRAIAQKTGGEYVHESQIQSLAEKLKPLSGGRIVRSTLVIWQTYWWFVAALALLVTEWLIRKRVGLV